MENITKCKSGIYVIKNLINNKMYIGSTNDFKARCRGHRTLLNRKCHFNTHLQSAVDKYGLENFEFDSLEEILITDFEDKDQFLSKLVEREMYYIQLHKSNDNKFGYNFREDCTTNKGNKFSDEARKKMSEAKKGKKWSQAMRDKMTPIFESKKGKHRTDWNYQEWINSLSEDEQLQYKENRKKSLDIARQTLKINKELTGHAFSQKGLLSYKEKRGHCVHMYALTGEFLQTFLTKIDALRFLGRNIKGGSELNKALDKYIFENYIFLSTKIDKISYKDRLKILKDSNQKHNDTPINQYDSNRILIKTWNQAKKAAQSLGYKSTSALTKAIFNNTPLKGFYFRKIEPYDISIIGKPDELLETPEMDNQQPSQELTSLEGSETNS